MTKISELPNTHDYPLRALAELRRKENTDPAYGTQKTWNTGDAFEWDITAEGFVFWKSVDKGLRPPIPAASIEDLRKAGMMPEPEKVIQGFERVDKPKQDLYQLLHQLRKKEQGEDYGYILTHKTPEGYDWWQEVFDGKEPLIPAASIEDLRRADMMPEPFYCENSESTAGPCAKQCAECAVDERAARKPEKFYCIIKRYGSQCKKQCGECESRMHDKSKPSITLSDYARMEREEEINELIQTMLTPGELRGYYMGNIIKYRMRAGKKAFTGEDQSDDLFNARNFEGLLAELKGGEG
jgi:hypothetical protein